MESRAATRVAGTLSPAHDRIGSTSRDELPIVVVGDPHNSRLRVVIEAIAGIEARILTLDAFRDGACAGDPTLVALIALAACPAPDDPCLNTLAHFRKMGIAVIAYADNARAWPLGARCRVLLAGANQLLDSREIDFSASIRTTLAAELERAGNSKAEARNVRMLAERHGFIGESGAIRDVFSQVIRISPLSDLPVLIIGESGTGKELVGRAIRALDPKRCAFPFVSVNCAAINPNLAESELFGYVRGAFTGAAAQRKGYFLAAQGGVLFLDEIGELSLEMQSKLLRVLEEREVLQVGADRTRPVDARVIAATNRDIATLVRTGAFRADLLFRLNVLSMRSSPLRERPEDLRPLAEHFAQAAWTAMGHLAPGIAPDFINALALLPLPGTARELRNLITFSIAHKTDSGPLGLKDLPPDLLRELALVGAAPECRPADDDDTLERSSPLAVLREHQWHLGEYLAHCERDILAAAIRTTCSQTEAARLLGVTPRSIYNKLRKHRIAPGGAHC